MLPLLEFRFCLRTFHSFFFFFFKNSGSVLADCVRLVLLQQYTLKALPEPAWIFSFLDLEMGSVADMYVLWIVLSMLWPASCCYRYASSFQMDLFWGVGGLGVKGSGRSQRGLTTVEADCRSADSWFLISVAYNVSACRVLPGLCFWGSALGSFNLQVHAAHMTFSPLSVCLSVSLSQGGSFTKGDTIPASFFTLVTHTSSAADCNLITLYFLSFFKRWAGHTFEDLRYLYIFCELGVLRPVNDCGYIFCEH